MNDKNHYKKFHITLLALLLIQVLVHLSFCIILICLYFQYGYTEKNIEVGI